MSRISVRGFAVASATAVTAVGAVVGVASGSEQGDSQQPVAAGANLLADIPDGQQAQQVSVNMGQQAQAQADAADALAKKAAEEAARKQAAQAAAKKAAEEAAAQRAKEAASRSASRTTLVRSSYTIAEVQQMAREMVSASQFSCFSNIVSRESGWNYRAINASSGAYGLLQALPGSKMATAGADWQTNPATQIKWGLNYMNSRYGSPCGAWSFWQANHWY